MIGSDLKNVGKLSAGDTNAQNLTISAKIDENFEEQGIKTTVYCKIFAIQQANLSETDARAEIMGNIVGLDTSKYRYVNYLESTGEQYIDTGYIYKTKPEIKTTIYLKTTLSADVLGTQTMNSTCFIVNYDGAYCYARYGNSGASSYLYGFGLEEWVNVSYGEVWKENGVEKYHKTGNYDFSGNTESLWLFLGRSNDHFRGRMQNVEFYDDDVLVRKMVTCLRNSDNKPGMYDTVNNVFYVNQGTGADFLWG